MTHIDLKHHEGNQLGCGSHKLDEDGFSRNEFGNRIYVAHLGIF